MDPPNTTDDNDVSLDGDSSDGAHSSDDDWNIGGSLEVYFMDESSVDG